MKVAEYIIRMWKHVALVAVCLCLVVAAHAQDDIDHPGHVNPEDMQVRSVLPSTAWFTT